MKTIERICRIFGFAAACMFLGAALVVTYEAFERYFSRPTSWAQDLAIYLMIGGAFFCQASVMLSDGHVRVDILIDRLKRPVRRALIRVTLALSLLYIVPLAWQSALSTYHSWAVGRMATSLFRVPTWIPESAIPIGSALLAVAIVVRIVRPPEVEQSADHDASAQL